MADEAIGDAAQATAAEGGAVLLIPNAEAEAAEQDGTPPTAGEDEPASPPAVVVSNVTADDHIPELIDARIGETLALLRAEVVGRIDQLIVRVGDMEDRLAVLELPTEPVVEEVAPIEVEPVPATESDAPPKAERFHHKFGSRR